MTRTAMPWIRLAAALLLLDASVTFANAWPTPGIRWHGGISIELAIFVGAAVIAARVARSPIGRVGVAFVSALWLLLVVGRYVDVTSAALYGRELNLYWDVRFIPDVAAMVVRVAPLWLAALTIAAAVAALTGLFLVLRWAMTTVVGATEVRETRRVLTIAVVAVLALRVIAPDVVERSVTATYLGQARFIVNALSRSNALPPSPAFDFDLSRVRNADIFLVFIESYGAVSDERPAVAAGLAGSRSRFAAAIGETNRDVVSAYVESPTFGGSSWLAHLSLLSGVEVRNPDTNARLMAERRDTMVRLFGRRGFRTIALMPGLRRRWPEGAFYGFQEIYGADRLAYRGPQFGWFAIPDQYSLFELDALEPSHPSRPPLFVFFPTISSHFPFSPTPPYQPDWPRMSDTHPYGAREIVRAYAREPDWTHFEPGYADSIAYEFDVLGGYLRLHASDDLVMVVLGDHQPPALVAGERASWNVPVHVVASRRAVLEPLMRDGFRRGLAPSTAAGRMHELLPLLLHAFSSDGHEQR